MMKRKRDFEEILISSDSEEQEQGDGSDEDWEEDLDDTDAEGTNDDEDDDDEDEDDEDEDEDEDDVSSNGSLSDDEDVDDDDDDDDDDDYEDDDDIHSSDSEQVLGSKGEKRGLNGTRGAESAQQGKKWTRQKHKWTKGSGHARFKTILNKEDQELFSEALNIIRKGDLEKLKSEHCKPYLRRYSLRLAGSKSVLCDRVKEHIELKTRGGMTKYPRSTFTVDCTGDACTGDIVLFKQRVKRNSYTAGTSTRLPQVGKRIVAGRIVKESYGSDKQQHTFTVEVLWSKGPRQLPFLYPLLIKGRNLYRFRTFRQPWPNEEERKKALQEKHSRGNVARNARECRVSGKEYSCSGRKQIQRSRTRVSLRRESKDTTYRQKSMTAVVRSFARHHDNRSQESHRTLTFKACYAGILIGTQGRNIGAIERASGARLQVHDHPSSRTLRMVAIVGAFEQVQVATQMVVQSFSSKGIPPPVETT